MTVAELRTDVVILTCAVSAGIHGALAPEHFEEAAAAGGGFVLAAVALAILAAVLTYRPTPPAFAAAAAVFGGLIAAYALVVTTGVPIVHPDREPVEALALVTKAVEAVGLVFAAAALRRPSIAFTLEHAKGT